MGRLILLSSVLNGQINYIMGVMRIPDAAIDMIDKNGEASCGLPRTKQRCQLLSTLERSMLSTPLRRSGSQKHLDSEHLPAFEDASPVILRDLLILGELGLWSNLHGQPQRPPPRRPLEQSQEGSTPLRIYRGITSCVVGDG
jgi:hypothetical protein